MQQIPQVFVYASLFARVSFNKREISSHPIFILTLQGIVEVYWFIFLSLNSIFCSSCHKYRSIIKALMSKLMSEYKAEGSNTPFYTANTFACRSRKGSIGIHFPCSGGAAITLCRRRSHSVQALHPIMRWPDILSWSEVFPQSEPFRN